MIDIGKKVVELNPISTAAKRINVIGREIKRNMTSLNRFTRNFIHEFSSQLWLLARVLAGVSNGRLANSSGTLARGQKQLFRLAGHSIFLTDF